MMLIPTLIPMLCVVVLATGATTSLSYAMEESSKDLAGMLQSLRSQQVKALALECYPAIAGTDLKKAYEALDVFYDMRAKAVLLAGLDSTFAEIQAYASGLVLDLVDGRDVQLVPSLTAALARAAIGTECTEGICSSQRTHRRNLVAIIQRITKLDFLGWDPEKAADLDAIIQRTKGWLVMQGDALRK